MAVEEEGERRENRFGDAQHDDGSDGNGGDLRAKSGALAGRNLEWELKHHVVLVLVVAGACITIKGRRPNCFPGLSLNDGTTPFLLISLDKTV